MTWFVGHQFNNYIINIFIENTNRWKTCRISEKSNSRLRSSNLRLMVLLLISEDNGDSQKKDLSNSRAIKWKILFFGHHLSENVTINSRIKSRFFIERFIKRLNKLILFINLRILFLMHQFIFIMLILTICFIKCQLKICETIEFSNLRYCF